MNGLIVALTSAAVILGVLEILLSPGLGIAGGIGVLLLLAATYLSSLHSGWLTASIVFLAATALFVLFFLLFYKTPLLNWLVSNSKKREPR